MTAGELTEMAGRDTQVEPVTAARALPGAIAEPHGSERHEMEGTQGTLEGTLARIALKLIWIYQHYISPFTPPSCRFYPTCSHYTYQAIARFGFWRGGWLGFCRLCKCQPFYRRGVDLVPETWPARSGILPQWLTKIRPTQAAPGRTLGPEPGADVPADQF